MKKECSQKITKETKSGAKRATLRGPFACPVACSASELCYGVPFLAFPGSPELSSEGGCETPLLPAPAQPMTEPSKVTRPNATETETWDLVITPDRGFPRIPFAELWKYRGLVLALVKRDFAAYYKQTILGPLWLLLQPLLTTFVFTVVFSRIARIPTDGIPPTLFYLSGVVLWSFFANCLTKTSGTFLTNAHIFGKVYFPRLTVPLATVVSSLFTFLIQFTLLLVAVMMYRLTGKMALSPYSWLIPLLLVQTALLGMGVGLIVSAATTRYRDLSFVLTFGTQLWMYATPIVYPLSKVSGRHQWLLALNPMTSIVELFRLAILKTGTILPWAVTWSLVITFLMLVIGALLFQKTERNVIDSI